MKKLLFLSTLVLSLMSFKSGEVEVEVQVDCDSFAAVMVAIEEEVNGCMDADEYNAAYQSAYNVCDQLMNQ